MDSSGFGSRSSYLDPDHIFMLVIGHRPRDLLAYLDSIPGASEDPNCRLVSLAGLALLDPRLRWFFPPLPEEDSWALFLAKYAWIQAFNSRLSSPQPVGNPFNFASDTVIDCPINHVGTFNQSSAVNSGGHASAFPIQDNSTLALAFEELSLRQPESEPMAPQELMQTTVSPQELEQNNHVLPTVDIKGKRPASEVDQLDAKILRVNVASSIAQDGTNGGAGLLMKIGSSRTAQFLSAFCFRIPCADPVHLFAAACAQGIIFAQAYQPATIMVESPVSAAQFPWQEVEELTKILKLKPPHWLFESISEESNHAARLLAIHGLTMMLPEMMMFNHPPEWLAPYIAGYQA